MRIQINNLLKRKHVDFIERVRERQKDCLIYDSDNGTVNVEMDVITITQLDESKNILIIKISIDEYMIEDRYMIDKDDFLSIEIM